MQQLNALLCALFSLVIVSIVSPLSAQAQVPSTRGGNDPVIPRFGYDFAPTLMLDLDGKYKMWWCTGDLSANPEEVDYIRYSEAFNLGGPWTIPQVVFTGSNVPGTFDRDSACSPSVIRVLGIYYMFYEGARFNSQGGLEESGMIGVAQSTDGISWTRLNSGNPIVTDHNWVSPMYGAGYPSVVYVDGWYYMLYYDDTGIDQTRRSYVLRSTTPLRRSTLSDR